MTDKINEACDRLVDQLSRLATNLDTVTTHAPGTTNAFLAATITQLETMRQDTIRAVDEAKVIQEDYNRVVEEKKDAEEKLARMRRVQLEAGEQSTFPGWKRRASRADEAEDTEFTRSPPRHRPFRTMAAIEDDETSSQNFVFRSSHQRAASRLAREEAMEDASTLWRDEDDADESTRLSWVEQHSAFEGDWTTLDRINWRAQMKIVAQNKSAMGDLTRAMDDYTFGDKRAWPQDPRPCFFGRMKRVKCSPGGEQGGRTHCDFCRVVTGGKENEKNKAKCHCTGLLAEGVASPYQARDETSGALKSEAPYETVAPFFNDNGARYVWTIKP